MIEVVRHGVMQQECINIRSKTLDPEDKTNGVELMPGRCTFTDLWVRATPDEEFYAGKRIYVRGYYRVLVCQEHPEVAGTWVCTYDTIVDAGTEATSVMIPWEEPSICSVPTRTTVLKDALVNDKAAYEKLSWWRKGLVALIPNLYPVELRKVSVPGAMSPLVVDFKDRPVATRMHFEWIQTEGPKGVSKYGFGDVLLVNRLYENVWECSYDTMNYLQRADD